MSRFRLLVMVAVGSLVAALATRAAAQGVASVCTQPFDPACNHLKCYQIKDTPITQATPIVQLDNQFGREVVFRLQPVLLCVPTQKSCCDLGRCSVDNCQPNPVPAPGLPHLKCYKIKAKECPNNDCTTLAKFVRGAVEVNLRDQFGPEGPLPLGRPVLLCAPVENQVVGLTTTTTTATTTSTTSTTRPCTLHLTDPLMCGGDCPPGQTCVFDTSGAGCVCSDTTCQGSGTACSGLCPSPEQSCRSNAVNPCSCCLEPGATCAFPEDCCSNSCGAVTDGICD